MSGRVGAAVMERAVLALWLAAFLFAAPLLLPSAAHAQASPSEHMTGYRWDVMNRLVGAISPDPDGAGPLTFPAMRYTYDINGQLIRTEKGVLAVWQAETVLPANWTGFTVQQRLDAAFDAVGNKLEVRAFGSDTVAVQRVTQMSYDANDRLSCSTVRMNLGAIPAASSDACALGTAGADGKDRVTKTLYDAAGQVTQVRKAVGVAGLEQAYATYTYTPNGKKKTVADANGNLATYEYDGFDRPIAWRFPGMTNGTVSASCNLGTITESAGLSGSIAGPASGRTASDDCEKYSYDRNGNRGRLVKRDGQILNFAYDGLNRMVQKRYPGGTAAGTCNGLTSDANDTCYTYDLRGLQTAVRFGADATTSSGITNGYDKAGRVLSASQFMDSVTRTLNYAYDANSNRIRLTFPDTQAFSYDYDGLNRTKGIYTGASVAGLAQVGISYDNFGRRGGGVDNAGLTSIGGDKTSYQYDPASRLQQLGHSFGGTGNNLGLGFQYNPASQVKQESQDNDLYAWTEAYNVARTYTVNGLNQYQTAGPAAYCYDLNGNLTADGTSVYSYDIENRLTQKRDQGATNTNCAALTFTGTLRASLRYDPLGRLYETQGTTAATITRFLYDGDALVGEYNAGGTLLHRYVHGPGVDEPLIWYAGSALTDPRYVHANHQGSVIGFANGSGQSLVKNSYDEWGIPGAGNAGRFQYTGQIWLAEAGLYHYKARVYSPTLGRFLQTDPIGYDDQINLYAYVGNDPGNFADPSGMISQGSCAQFLSRSPSGSCWEADDTASQQFMDTKSVAATARTVATRAAIATGVILADDVTVVGVADDPLAIVSGVVTVVAIGVALIAEAVDEPDEKSKVGYHYTDARGAAEIARTGLIAANSRGRVYFTDVPMNEKTAQNTLFIGATTHAGRGSHVVAFRYPSSLPWQKDGGTPFGKIHFGSLRNTRHVEFLYVGKNNIR